MCAFLNVHSDSASCFLTFSSSCITSTQSLVCWSKSARWMRKLGIWRININDTAFDLLCSRGCSDYLHGVQALLFEKWRIFIWQMDSDGSNWKSQVASDKDVCLIWNLLYGIWNARENLLFIKPNVQHIDNIPYFFG